MNAKQKRTLLILAAAVAVLTAALLLVRHNRQRAAEAAAEAARAAAQSGILTDAATPYTALTYFNGSATLSFAVDETGSWYWTNDPEFPLDQAYLVKLTNTLAALKPQQTITDGDTLEAYGLTEPSATLSATEENGSVTTVALGKTTTDGNSYYMLMNGQESPVYIVSDALYQEMSAGIYDMCLLPEFPALTQDAVTSIAVSGAVETRINAAADRPAEDGGGSSGSGEETPAVTWRSGGEDVTEQAAELVSQVLSLSFRSCVDYKPTDEAVSLCGFDEPAAVLTVTYTAAAGTEETLTLALGGATLDGEGRYARWNDDTTVYSIDADSLDTILSTAANGLAPDAAPAD